MSVEVKGVSKRFDDSKRGSVQAVDNVSFSVKPGKIFGLLGLNGAGKTTILRMISTILKPMSGTITVGGFDAAKQPDAVRRCIGFLPSDTGLYDRFSPKETLEFYARLSKYPKDKLAARVDEVMRLLDMKSFQDTRCEKLSSGMKQRVALARSIVHDPPVIIFDEPTNSLDVLTALAVHDFIRFCRDQGKSVLLSTHIMSEAEKLCDEIGVIHGGRLLSHGTLDSLRQTTDQQSLEEIFVSVVRQPDNGSPPNGNS